MTARRAVAALVMALYVTLELGMVWGFHAYYVGHLYVADGWYLAFLADHMVVLGEKISLIGLVVLGLPAYTLWRKTK